MPRRSSRRGAPARRRWPAGRAPPHRAAETSGGPRPAPRTQGVRSRVAASARPSGAVAPPRRVVRWTRRFPSQPSTSIPRSDRSTTPASVATSVARPGPASPGMSATGRKRNRRMLPSRRSGRTARAARSGRRRRAGGRPSRSSGVDGRSRARPASDRVTSSSRYGFRRCVGTAQRTARAADAPSESRARATSSAVQGSGLAPQRPSGPGERHARGAAGEMDLHRVHTGAQRPLDLLAARGPARARAAAPGPSSCQPSGAPETQMRPEPRSAPERGAVPAWGTLEQPGAVVQLQRERPGQRSPMRSPSGATGRGGGSARGMPQGPEPVTDRATARGRDGGILDVGGERLAHADHGLAPLGPVQPDAPHEARRPGERRDAQGAAVLAVVEAQHEARLRKGDVRHRRPAGEGAGAAEERLDEWEERLVLGSLDQGHPVQLQGHRIVRGGAALAGPASADPDAEHARVAVLCTGPCALQAKSRPSVHNCDACRRATAARSSPLRTPSEAAVRRSPRSVTCSSARNPRRRAVPATGWSDGEHCRGLARTPRRVESLRARGPRVD